MDAKTVVIGGIYQHYKGKNYKVLGKAHHSETLEEMVIYEALYEQKQYGPLWVRPAKMFLENIEINGYIQPRFKLLDQNSIVSS